MFISFILYDNKSNLTLFFFCFLWIGLYFLRIRWNYWACVSYIPFNLLTHVCWTPYISHFMTWKVVSHRKNHFIFQNYIYSESLDLFRKLCRRYDWVITPSLWPYFVGNPIFPMQNSTSKRWMLLALTRSTTLPKSLSWLNVGFRSCLHVLTPKLGVLPPRYLRQSFLEKSKHSE